MRIVKKLIYILFILIVFVAFVFFGGGGALVKVGEIMQGWELSMKETLGIFCKEGEQKIKAKAGKVTGTYTKNKDVGE